ncbi:MAG: hypothetical protein [Lokiarchaeia virus VerdaV1]|uniref:Uncharacterized protein n=1 Tax=Lokiarchaeia virus VerdaV1 TaxID=3070170 RepID=A0AA35G9R1_9CAUD|nr:MAG: hypothetical protein QIT41_gp26 [Lokiarchaeia virus VerdaV1]BDI54875.1 MAG: hypothetical protein [Lokiarchaeia virus VerdaV1]
MVDSLPLRNKKRIEALEALFREFSREGDYLEVKKILQEEKEAKQE